MPITGCCLVFIDSPENCLTATIQTKQDLFKLSAALQKINGKTMKKSKKKEYAINLDSSCFNQPLHRIFYRCIVFFGSISGVASNAAMTAAIQPWMLVLSHLEMLHAQFHN